MNNRANKPSLRISGEIIDHLSQRGVAGLRLEAWDNAEVCTDVVECATTDSQGAFDLALEKAYLDQLFPDSLPTFCFRVFHGNRMVTSTKDSVVWHGGGANGRLRILVNLDGPPGSGRPANSAIRVQLLHAINGPLRGHTVRAVDKRVASVGFAETDLGSAVTDEAGRAEIRYRPEQLGDLGKTHADLVVRVFDSANIMVAHAEVWHAHPTTIMELVVGGGTYRGPSEFDRLASQLRHAIPEGAVIAHLTAAQVAHLAGSIRLDERRVGQFVAAHRIAAEIGDPEVTVETIYAILRQGVTADRRAVLSRSQFDQRQALQEALRENTISSRYANRLEATLEVLERATVQFTFESPDPGNSLSLGEMLMMALSRADATEFVGVLRNQAPLARPEKFWEDLATRPTFQGEGIVPSLQFLCQTAAVTRQHLPLVRLLQTMRTDGRVTTVWELARFEESDWLALMSQEMDGRRIGAPRSASVETEEQRETNYAASLTATMEHIFPTIAIASRMAKDMLPASAAAARFLVSNAGYEIGKIRLRRYLRRNPDALAQVPEGDRAAVFERVEALERLTKITKRWRHLQPLLADRVLSAQTIYQRLGKRTFLEKYRDVLGLDLAETVFARAKYVSTSALALFLKYHASVNSTTAHVMPGLSEFRKDPVGTIQKSLESPD
jgi:hypothetical protein